MARAKKRSKGFWSHNRSLDILVFALLVFPYLFWYQFYSTSYLDGHDAYYHTKVASIYREQGLIREFPWMYYTSFNQNYADRWFLFHVAQIPFTFGDLVLGTKLFIPLFATLMLVVFYLILKRFDVKYPWLWVALALSSRGFFFRISLARAFLFAQIFLLLGFYFLSRKEHRGLFIVSMLFALTYSSFPLILFLTVVFMVAEYVHEKRIEKKALVYCTLGIVVGLVINPYFPLNVIDYTNQISNMLFWTAKAGGYSDAQMSVITPGETTAPNLFDITNTSNIMIFILAFAVENYLFSKKKLFKERRIETTSAILISIPFGLMYLTTARFNEYWIPFAVLACALCFGPVIKDLLKRKSWEFKFSGSSFSGVKMGLHIVFVTLVLINISWILSYGQTSEGYDAFIESHIGPSNWLMNNSPQGSLVFTSWDDTAILFFFNSHNHYVVGMDALYLNIYNETLFSSYTSILSGEESDIYQALVDDFKADYILVNPTYMIHSRLKQDSRFSKVYENDYWTLYEL
jgi:hypothetical protein